jgi:uncharacterized protein (TIGR02284 family)
MEMGRVLKDLMAVCRESAEGFRKAAGRVQRGHLAGLFRGIAQERAQFAEELAALEIECAQQAAAAGYEARELQGWRDLEGTSDDAKFLARCEEGEENTLRHFEHALTQDLPAMVRAVVHRQRLAVQEALLQLRDVEKVGRAG